MTTIAAMIGEHRSLRCLTMLFVFTLVLSARVFARDVWVTVIDGELDMPLEGAVVRSPDGQDWECGPDGVAVVTVPDDTRIILRAAYPGYEAGRAVLPPDAAAVTISLTLSGVMEGNELVIEAARPRASETVPGRSIALSGRELARSAEIGAIEDVMNSIKLLPGVGYAGTSNMKPSIRGGDPGDFVAVFDGFYVENPYHLGGGVSIFDPHMVESAQLSHGIFSARYGHTITGILDVTSKKGDTELSSVELGLSTSAANLNLSRPINDKGAFTLMMKSTYWAPVVWAAQWMSGFIDNEQLDMMNYVTIAPYIISGAFSADYRFTPNLALNSFAFLGGDGGGAEYKNSYDNGGYTNLSAQWINTIGFVTSGLLWNPRNDMILNFRLGAGFNRTDLDANVENSLTVPYTKDFIEDFNDKTVDGETIKLGPSYTVDNNTKMVLGNETDTVQARVDYDWDWGSGFIFAAGVQELYSRWLVEQSTKTIAEFASGELGGKTLYINYPVTNTSDADNHAFNTSGYVVGEWISPSGFFETELGLRLDTFTFWGRDFSVKSAPAFNPRLNMDFHLLKNKGRLDSLSLTLGSGLFSSMTDNVTSLEKGDVDDYELKPNRSWTSLVGINLNFFDHWTLNIETYYKYVFSRAYRINWTNTDSPVINTQYYFDGEGNVWGADLMLQKRGGDFIDGWLAYTFTYARYREPGYVKAESNESNYRTDGYFPSFHRFHNLNVILNLKPQNKFHIYIRYGIASGRPKPVVGEIDYYPVLVKETGTYIQKFKRGSYYSDDSRTTLSMPFDIKFSWFFFNKKGRTTGEFYIAVENLASLFYLSRANTTFNQYTGKEDTGSTAAVYELSIPIPSTGIKWSF